MIPLTPSAAHSSATMVDKVCRVPGDGRVALALPMVAGVCVTEVPWHMGAQRARLAAGDFGLDAVPL